MDWLQLGDGNNAYFHASVKAKNSNLGIKQLRRQDGTTVTTHDDLEAEIIHFYRQLVGISTSRLKGLRSYVRGLN